MKTNYEIRYMPRIPKMPKAMTPKGYDGIS